MNRSDFLLVLEHMAPAVSKNETIAKLMHYWFTGTHVFADSTVIKMQAPIATPFDGGIPGSRLLSMLKASRFKECNFISKNDDELVIKAVGSSTKLTFAKLPAKVATDITVVDKIKSSQAVQVNRKKLKQAIQVALISVAKEEPHNHVTAVGLGASIHLFATNDTQLSHALVPVAEGEWEGRALVPTEFLRVLLAITDESSKNVTLQFTDTHVKAQGVNGILLTGALGVERAKPMPFDKIVAGFYPPEVKKKMVPVPTKMELVMERASIIEGDSMDEILTEIKVADGKATFSTVSKKGDAFDEVEFGKAGDAEIAVSPKKVREGIGIFESMTITDRALIMESKGLTYYVLPGSKKA